MPWASTTGGPWWYDPGFTSHGFVYSGGSYTTLDDPAAGTGTFAQGTLAQGINNAGTVVGNYFDAAGVSHGFLYSGGSYTTLHDDPAAAGNVTFVQGINASGTVVGYYTDAGGTEHGFLYSGGSYTTLDDPAAAGLFSSGGQHGCPGDQRRRGRGGLCADGPHVARLVNSGGVYTTLDDPAADNGTSGYGINAPRGPS